LLLTGFARGFTAPATFSLISQIVPRELLPSASTWNSAVWQTGAVTGPALGGVLLGLFGISFSYGVSFVLAVISTLSIAMISKRPRVRNTEPEPILKSVLVGVKFVFSNQLIVAALSLDLFAVFFGGAVALLPIFVQDILQSGPESFGLLRAAPSLGAVAMGLFIAHRPLPKKTGDTLLLVVVGFGLCMIAFALSRNLYLSIAILALSGAFDSVSVVIRATILQVMTPDHMRGRVAAVNMMFIGSSNEIGEAESGIAAKLLGVVPSVIFGGCMTLVVTSIAAFKAPHLRSLTRDELHGKKT
jgi:MFS family permease